MQWKKLTKLDTWKSIFNGFYTLWFKPEPVFFKERFKECSTCEFNSSVVNKTTNAQCLVCGCFIKAKCSSASESCPLGKWNTYEKEGDKSI